MGTIGRPGTSVTNHPTTLRNITEKRRSHTAAEPEIAHCTRVPVSHKCETWSPRPKERTVIEGI